MIRFVNSHNRINWKKLDSISQTMHRMQSLSSLLALEAMEEEEKNMQQSQPFPSIQEEEDDNAVLFIDEPFLKQSCFNCKKYVHKSVVILTKEDNHSRYRCVGCFAKLDQPPQNYKVINNLNFPIIRTQWTAANELLFLSSIEKYGFGNWAEIKDRMELEGARFSQQELKHHYNDCYLSFEDNLPKFFDFDSQSYPRRNVNSIASIATTTANREESNLEEVEDQLVFGLQSVDRSDLVRQMYNEKRNELETEYDSNAEFMLANLQFRDDDSPEQTRLKFRLIEDYNKRLEKRREVREFILQHRLLDEAYQQLRFNTDYEKEAHEELKFVARFMKLIDYNKLVKKLAHAKQLKSTIEGIRRFRRMHPSDFSSIDQYLNCQPEESKPRKKNQYELGGIRAGKKFQQIIQKKFQLKKPDFEYLVSSAYNNGKKFVHKNVEAIVLEKSY